MQLGITEEYLQTPKKIHPDIIQHSYNLHILSDLDKIHNIANLSRNKGIDPSTSVESELALDMPERIERMLRIPVAKRLRELLGENRTEQAALTIADEIALGKFGFAKTDQLLNLAVRTGLAVVTDGVTIAPLQGISTVKIKANEDGSRYAAVSFAGPIRAVGGTEAALCLVIADRVRKSLGLENYRANAWGEDEVGRVIEELRIYEREVGNFQYRISDDDLRHTILHIPIEIDGVDTDPIEVTFHRNMKRITTNRVRGGALRVLNDGIIGRARKLGKLLEELSIRDWNWLSELQGGQTQERDSKTIASHFDKIISGRTMLAKPNSPGGFRLRYGRSFNTGISTIGIHPATAELLDYPVVVGTQVKIDMPSKAGTIAFVDTIDGPIVRLKNGSVIRVHDISHAKKVKGDVDIILFMGDILISFGDFLENNTRLASTGYVEELWVQELQRASKTFQIDLDSKGISSEYLESLRANPFSVIPTFKESLILAENLKIGLHPRYTFYWDLSTPSEIILLRQNIRIREDRLIITENLKEIKTILEKVGVPHVSEIDSIVIEREVAENLRTILALDKDAQPPSGWSNTCEFLSILAGFSIKPKTSAFVGVRVGRPEKAALRKMKPPVHVLFPITENGGPSRDIMTAYKTGTIQIELVKLVCEGCGSSSLGSKCLLCGSHTKILQTCSNCSRQVENVVCPACKLPGLPYSKMDFNVKQALYEAWNRVNHRPESPFRGVKRLTNSTRWPEALEKGILRQKHNLSVYKDGTIRFDATNAPLTHVTAKMIDVSLEKLRDLGYEKDIQGKDLTLDDQLFELNIQDIVIPYEAAEFLFDVANFVDDLLIHVYEQEAFYRFKSKKDIIGHLIIGLAPHTSVGVIGRVIGVTNSQVCFAHPFWHSAKRRDCDGDSDSISLLFDVFLNFSRFYLSAQIGGLMDAPLIIQPIIIPQELPRQAHNLDVMQKYPLEFYEETNLGSLPTKTVPYIDLVRNRLKSSEQFHNFHFTHSTSNIAIGPRKNSYSTINTLAEKLENQIRLAKKIAAVNPNEVVTSVLKTHLLPDILGNMEAYTSQSFRCKSCNSRYRRLPVKGECLDCGGQLQATVTRGSVEKYLKLATKLCKEFDVDPYVKNKFEILTDELAMLFGSKHEPVQADLTAFFE